VALDNVFLAVMFRFKMIDLLIDATNTIYFFGFLRQLSFFVVMEIGGKSLGGGYNAVPSSRHERWKSSSLAPSNHMLGWTIQSSWTNGVRMKLTRPTIKYKKLAAI